ncbi:hypothetical protein JRQ81_003742 [Phrynocephalus forsythii]|uniref:Vacuolar ATPase assembly protein VMA22 n=1 Tax=Phrynocephalus forsythii TaxID=171643 RepID=A0A9Q1AXR2_9SAUR|nr:hypothetical protein JRQ81_003742 [Phrynocephalus forsythii]
MAPAEEDMGPEEVCKELDQLVLQLFDALEMLQTKRKAFNSLIEQGWFCLSKSRYAMGNKSVSTLQYGPQMTPLVWVKTSEKEKSQVEFVVVSEEEVRPSKAEHGATVEEVGPSDQGLRRRKGLEKPEGLHPAAEAAAQTAAKSEHHDPLSWFGILVPQSLRQAQRTFREGIHLAAEIASLQSEIETIRRRYRRLLERKHGCVAREKEICS